MYTGQAAGRQQRLLLKKGEASRKPHSASSSQSELDFSEEEITGSNNAGIDGEQIISRSKVNGDAGSKVRGGSLIDQIDRITDGRELTQIWQGFQKQEIKGNFRLF